MNVIITIREDGKEVRVDVDSYMGDPIDTQEAHARKAMERALKMFRAAKS